jgi:adenylylsulfate kinase-like enzyme
MIYWFTGQPGAGKTVLANKLKEVLEKPRNFAYKIFRIDGDEMRDLFSNKDYSIKGRIANIDAAQKIAHYLHNQEKGYQPPLTNFIDVDTTVDTPEESLKKILNEI